MSIAKNVVFESPTKWHKWLIYCYLLRGFKIWIIEPFHAFHHAENDRAIFYPRELPRYVWELIKNRKAQLIEANNFSPHKMYLHSADRAVRTIKDVYDGYANDNRLLIECVCGIIQSKKAEEIFQKELCQRLSVFFSVNQMLGHLGQYFAEKKVIFYGEISPLDYHYLTKITKRAKIELSDSSRISFGFSEYFFKPLHNFKQYIIAILRIVLQTLASGIFQIVCPKKILERKEYTYAFAVNGGRQLRNNNRRADFLVDNQTIHDKETIFLSLIRLSPGQNDELEKLKGAIFYCPSLKKNYIGFSLWRKLLAKALGSRWLRNGAEIHTASLAVAEYLRWQVILKAISFKHFITHCDFSAVNIARHLVLKADGVTTWYFTDSMNSGTFEDKQVAPGVLHPFWTYLNYDHFITWDDYIVRYYEQHHVSIANMHVVGCLWADKIAPTRTCSNEGAFAIAAFDTTYTCNSFTSYDEGISFARHLFQLVEDIPWITLIIKEKKAPDMDYHNKLDPIKGPKLLDFYEKIYKHPRITRLSNQVDVATLISNSDMVISFPYTSTTFEALCSNKLAIWHDPEQLYRNTPYGQISGVTTHGYNELKARVLAERQQRLSDVRMIFSKDPSLMDPYCDGKAIDRFRALLAKGATE